MQWEAKSSPNPKQEIKSMLVLWHKSIYSSHYNLCLLAIVKKTGPFFYKQLTEFRNALEM